MFGSNDERGVSNPANESVEDWVELGRCLREAALRLAAQHWMHDARCKAHLVNRLRRMAARPTPRDEC